MLFKPKRQEEERIQPKEIRDEEFLNQKRGVIFGKIKNPLKKLKKLATQSQNVLLTLKSIYPFDLYPDTVIIDENKVNIRKKEIFGAENVHSILIEDITNLTVSTGPFTATLDIVDSSNLRFPITYTIRHLNIKKSLLARRLIQGLIACKREGVDLSTCDNEEVLKSLEELGRARGESSK